MKMINIYKNPHWLLSANTQNFELSIKYKQIWGVQDKWFPQWKALEKGNVVFFYISDVKRVIGVGKIGNKFIQREPLWPDEINEGIVKYPLRFEFSIDYFLPKEKQKKQGIDLSNFIRTNLGQGAFADLLRGGINFIRHKSLIKFLYKGFKETLNYEIVLPYSDIFIEGKKFIPKEVNLHDKLKKLISAIGRMNNFLSEEEYSVENVIFDAIWRRVNKGSPTYVFEIQVSGDIYHALARLKHAFDLWNSNIFLIIAYDKDFSIAQKLLSGTFHEIKNKIRIISADDIKELFNRKKSWIDYERKLGIL